MPVHSIVEAADGPAEQLLLTVGRAGVLSCRAIDAGELETLLRLLGPPSERQRTDLKRATDIVLVEDGAADLLAAHGRAVQHQRRGLCDGARPGDARMSTAALKRELALLRSSLAALKPSQSAALDDPIAWAERIAGLTLDPWQCDVLLSASPRLLLNATRQSGKSTVAALRPPGRFWRAASPWWQPVLQTDPPRAPPPSLTPDATLPPPQRSAPRPPSTASTRLSCRLARLEDELAPDGAVPGPLMLALSCSHPSLAPSSVRMPLPRRRCRLRRSGASP